MFLRWFDSAHDSTATATAECKVYNKTKYEQNREVSAELLLLSVIWLKEGAHLWPRETEMKFELSLQIEL